MSLQMLRDEAPPHPIDEVAISRRLYFLMQRANRALAPKQRLEWPILCNIRNQPDADDAQPTSYEDKVPDFKCTIIDHGGDPERSNRSFDIECKRLGAPPSKTWILNRNYILDGVVRFIKAEWGYGRSTTSGVMIGYVQSMNIADILTEVNANAKNNALPRIRLNRKGWSEKSTSRLNHKLDRPEVLPTPFDLRHLWIDLRP